MKTVYSFVKILLVILAAAGFAGCLKEKMLADGFKTLRIEFDSQTLTINDIDSARLLLYGAMDSDPSRHHLIKSADGFYFDLSTLPSAIYRGEVAIYTKKDQQNNFFQHYVPIDFNVDLVSSIVLPAPLPSTSALWRKRLIIKNEALGVRAMMPVEMDDPYFEIRIESDRWDSVNVHRAAYKQLGNDRQLVREHYWICEQDCFSAGSAVLKNHEAFIPFVNFMKAMIWTEAETSLYLRDRVSGEEFRFEYRWQK